VLQDRPNVQERPNPPPDWHWKWNLTERRSKIE